MLTQIFINNDFSRNKNTKSPMVTMKIHTYFSINYICVYFSQSNIFLTSLLNSFQQELVVIPFSRFMIFECFSDASRANLNRFLNSPPHEVRFSVNKNWIIPSNLMLLFVLQMVVNFICWYSVFHIPSVSLL